MQTSTIQSIHLIGRKHYKSLHFIQLLCCLLCFLFYRINSEMYECTSAYLTRIKHFSYKEPVVWLDIFWKPEMFSFQYFNRFSNESHVEIWTRLNSIKSNSGSNTFIRISNLVEFLPRQICLFVNLLIIIVCATETLTWEQCEFLCLKHREKHKHRQQTDVLPWWVTDASKRRDGSTGQFLAWHQGPAAAVCFYLTLSDQLVSASGTGRILNLN